ncbi:MAG TPA: SDR family NAD(P)-dependent oxidoreductase [Rubrivivax sp.]|nr:SDR family NAD(P)-dependent oxidoreductase [Rubrivivax sp.]
MPSGTSVDLGSRRFSLDDQIAFGAASHDVNPMHVDPVAARRTLTGLPIVHGVHTLLQALERWRPAAEPEGPLRLDCEFKQPIDVDDAVDFHQTVDEQGVTLLDAVVDRVVCTRVRIAGPAVATAAAPPPAAVGEAIVLAPATVPCEAAAATHVGRSYLLAQWAPSLAAAFPHVERRLGRGAVGALAALSYTVGMVCPGLHSVFSSLTLIANGATPGAALRVRVLAHEARFGMITMAFDGPLRGELIAFERAPPQRQPRADELADRVPPEAFARTRAIVVGGSRGLGELTAKLLAAGGADVVLTYASGRDDAQRVADEINACGRGRARPRRCDLSEETDWLALFGPQAPDAVFYFATPRIYRKSAELFDRRAFGQFTDTYLDRFASLCLALEQAASERKVTVYLPSTVFIDQRPKGLTAYAMAKAAAEILADDLSRSLRRVRVVHTRLPRLATDQTAGVRGLDHWTNTEVLLGTIRSVLEP